MISWTPSQIEHYKTLMAQGRDMNWTDRIRLCFPNCKLTEPVKAEELCDAERELGRSLPPDLKDLLLESNGIISGKGDAIIEGLDYIISDTKDLWSYDDLYIAPTTMVAFGGPGNGDRYFFPILPNLEYKDEIYLWDHETDAREWIAQSLRDFLYRRAIDEN